ncbi:lysis protein [Cedecea neteri]|uniref:lysis protein n=1 Tax=Cedecea neteri TaxID=158822 RepID=UPI002AA82427|nr:lysis protein [Cedecea neteri]WPU24499.1 lysis protein [Cedecea neteri]
MSSKWKIIAVGMLILMLVLTAWRASSERKRADAAEHSLAAATSAIHDMTVRQRNIAALDSKYTQELADAKQTIEQLQRDVAAGDKRLRLNATCPVRTTTSAPRMDDAAAPGLTDAAERDYFRLRERIETSNKQIAGLQEYIRQQCLR